MRKEGWYLMEVEEHNVIIIRVNRIIDQRKIVDKERKDCRKQNTALRNKMRRKGQATNNYSNGSIGMKMRD